MSLSEGKMFTIEALNQIEGFVWPKHASHAFMNEDERFVSFTSGRRPDVVVGALKRMFAGVYAGSVSAGCKHPDWRNSLITREEFESVDGWVRNDGDEPVINGDFDLKLSDNEMIYFSDVSVDGWDWSVPCGDGNTITHWRYHKPQKQEVRPEPESNASAQPASQEGIESLISKHKAVKEIARLARIELEQVEAAEHSLMLSIEAWAESHGFDIRVLSESEEKPELVITDWRDLKIDDVVSWIVGGYRGEFTVHELYRDNEGGNPCAAIMAPNGKQYNVYADEIKFIRRPEKK